MKVLLVSSNSGSIGGGERYLVYLAEGLLATGHQVDVVLSSLREMDEISYLLSNRGATVHRLRLLGLKHRKLRFLSALSDIRQQRRLTRFVQSLGPDIIHVNQQYDEDGLDYLRAVLKIGPPVAGTIHLPMCRGKLERPFGWLRAQFMKQFYRTHPYEKIFVSRDSRDEFCELYGQDCHTHIIRNGISLPHADFANRAMETTYPMTLGTVGRLDKQKNPLLLLRAFATLLGKNANARLVFVGDGPERANVETEARLLRLAAHVTITGWLPDPEEWWPRFSVFAMSSEFEGMSLALLEAVVRGIPCVVTETQGVSEVAECATWVEVVPKNNVTHLASGLERALQKPHPAQEIVRMVAAEFSCQRMALETVAVYNRSTLFGNVNFDRIAAPIGTSQSSTPPLPAAYPDTPSSHPSKPELPQDTGSSLFPVPPRLKLLSAGRHAVDALCRHTWLRW